MESRRAPGSPHIRRAYDPCVGDESGLQDARDVFERTVIAMCRERGLHRRLSPGDIGNIVEAMTDEFAGTLDELESFVSREEWDEIHALAQRERTMAAARCMSMETHARERSGDPSRR